MQLTTYLSTTLMTAVIVVGTTAVAADLQKEGSYKGFYAGVGAFKTEAANNDRARISYNETGFEVTDGLLDRTTWHCWGAGDYVGGTGADQGHCVATDNDGDKITMSMNGAKHAVDQKVWTATLTCTEGTGKYVGITCIEKDTIRANEFPAPSEGNYVIYINVEGTYKLRAPTQ